MDEIKIRELVGANMDIDLVSDNVDWNQSVCPWNAAENSKEHKCAVKDTSICKYFYGIKHLDSVLCSYPNENKEVLNKNPCGHHGGHDAPCYAFRFFLYNKIKKEKKMKVKIAFAQLLPGKDLGENLDIGKKACVTAKEKGADIILFPEMWSDGYDLPQDEKELSRLSIRKDSDFINAFRGLAGELQMAVGITFLETNDPRPLNSVIFFDRHGNEILHYSKLHTCAFDDEKVLSEGEDFHVADLDLEEGTVKIGSMICFDREFPESARILMLKGAELILAPNACPMEINRLSALRTRAYENMVAVATCNYPEGHPDCNGRSTLFDGVPWQREAGFRDMCVFEAPGAPGVYVAELDLDKLRTHRSEDIMGDKYRHPEKYGILSDPNVCNVIGGEFVHW